MQPLTAVTQFCREPVSQHKLRLVAVLVQVQTAAQVVQAVLEVEVANSLELVVQAHLDKATMVVTVVSPMEAQQAVAVAVHLLWVNLQAAHKLQMEALVRLQALPEVPSPMQAAVAVVLRYLRVVALVAQAVVALVLTTQAGLPLLLERQTQAAAVVVAAVHPEVQVS